jgi:hypothetical protein
MAPLNPQVASARYQGQYRPGPGDIGAAGFPSFRAPTSSLSRLNSDSRVYHALEIRRRGCRPPRCVDGFQALMDRADALAG